MEHNFNLKVKDNKLKAIVRSNMFRSRVERNPKAYNRAKVKQKGFYERNNISD